MSVHVGIIHMQWFIGLSSYKKSIANESYLFIKSDIPLQAIDDWVFKMPGLQALLLNKDEWKILGKIADILEVWIYKLIIIV